MLGRRHVAPGILAAYMDKELAPNQVTKVEAHLATCNVCYQKALRQGKTAELVRSASETSGIVTVKASAPLSLIARGLQHLPKASYRPGLVTLLVALTITFVLIYGIQSLVTDVLSRDNDHRNGRVATFVEDHLTYENVYRTTGR